jgi:4-diphosphocytidyl-2-C-methyl-D-erythritol kinase
VTDAAVNQPMRRSAGRLPAVVEAPAKLTLGLRITGVRSDGLHLLDAEMVTLDFGDTLTFTPGDGLRVVVETSAASEVPVAPGADNLVSQALVMLGLRAKVTLRKRIPVGGGLGGGSADAAAVLRWAGCADLDLAARLGSDVPFCLVGGRARVRGIGEIIEPLPPGEHAGETITLATPPFGVSTPAVYRAWDVLGGPTAEGPNDLESAALAVEPRLAEWRDRLWRVSGVRPALAGSGSTWYVPGAFPGAGRIVARVARE